MSFRDHGGVEQRVVGLDGPHGAWAEHVHDVGLVGEVLAEFEFEHVVAVIVGQHVVHGPDEAAAALAVAAQRVEGAAHRVACARRVGESLHDRVGPVQVHDAGASGRVECVEIVERDRAHVDIEVGCSAVQHRLVRVRRRVVGQVAQTDGHEAAEGRPRTSRRSGRRARPRSCRSCQAPDCASCHFFFRSATRSTLGLEQVDELVHLDAGSLALIRRAPPSPRR